MEKRSSDRITTRLRVEFDGNNTIYCSKVINLSEQGMLIRTAELNFPLDTQFDIFLHMEDTILEIPVKVRRLAKEGDTYDSLGVELIYPPQAYLEFVTNVRGYAEDVKKRGVKKT